MNISEQIIAKISNTLGNEIKSLEKKLKLQLEKTLKLQRTVATKNNPMLTQSDAFYRSLKKSQEIRDKISKLLAKKVSQPDSKAELATKIRQKQRDAEARITSTTYERERKRNFRTVDTLFKNR